MSGTISPEKNKAFWAAYDAMRHTLDAIYETELEGKAVATGYLVGCIDLLSRNHGKDATYTMLQGMADELAKELIGPKIVKSAGDPQP